MKSKEEKKKEEEEGRRSQTKGKIIIGGEGSVNSIPKTDIKGMERRNEERREKRRNKEGRPSHGTARAA